MDRLEHSKVIMLPGSVLPVDVAYQDLIPLISPDATIVTKDLEIYATVTPPADFSVGLEVAGILNAADAAGFERFHLVGYSAGGAMCLAFVEAYPDRVLSLALLEPAWDGVPGASDDVRALWQGFQEIAELPVDQRMPAFVRAQLRPGVNPLAPAPGPPPPWMAKRPPGIAALIRTLAATPLDHERLKRFDRPVYFALGGLSNPDYFERMSRRLAEDFPDFTVELYPQRHHFDPPHRAEPERVASALTSHWSRAELTGMT